ncbi:MAG: PKD domain-containing protein, partial [Candidatus Hodarchaeota archaeon]
FSDDGGATWSLPTLANDDGGDNSQFLPWLDVDQQTGLVTVVWYDARNDPNNQLVEVFIAISSNGGATFQPNIRVSDGQSDCSVNNPLRYRGNYLEYIGIAAHSLMAHPVWSDNSLDSANLDFFTDDVVLTPVDVYILVDLSGSFWDDLPVFQAQAPAIIAELSTASPNIKFGLGKFEDYPINPFGSAAAGDQAYERLVDLTFDTNVVLNAIEGLFTRDGMDLPESQLAALYQAATGAGQDLSGEGYPGASIPAGQQANFRDGAIKLILLWTDAEFHLPGDPGDIPYPGPSFEETVNAILALDPPKVIGISSGTEAVADLEEIAEATGALAPPGGVDLDGDGIIDISEGDPLVCSISTSGQGIGDAMVALTKAAINKPPIANAGPDQVVEQETHAGTQVTLDGSGSFDPDGDLLTYQWTWTGGTSTEVNPTFVFPLGTHTVTLTVSDGEFIATDIVGITVQDTIPPEITVISEPIVLWPPNHKYHTIEISDFISSVTDICDISVGIDDIIITSVSSDEPENAKGEGDGNTWNDIIIVDSQTVDLRAERQGDGNGRVYTINFEVTDVSGNTATGSFQVWVPHNKKSTAIDDGASEGYIVYSPP